MEREVVGLVGVIAMVVLMFLRVPVAYALALVGFIGVAILRNMGAAEAVFAAEPFGAVLFFDLTTIPAFMLMGYLTFVAGFTRELYDTARIWFARTSGGLAAASVFGCAGFSAVSGSSLATAAAMGKIAVPEMLHRNYDRGLATGVIAASGTLGSLIPPSVLMILYAVFTEQSIAVLFIAGIIPGILSAGIYIAMILARAKMNPALAPGMTEGTSWREKLYALRGTWGILLLFIVVIGGIIIGLFTPMEAGAIGAAGAFLIALFARRLDKEKIQTALMDTLRQSTIIFAIIFGAFIFTRFMALSGLGQYMADIAISISDKPIPVILALSLLYIVLGTFMGAIEIMLITLPIVIPVVESYDLSLIWFGVIMIKYLEIGLITPPLGFNVFVISSVVGKAVSIVTIFRGVMWFLAMDFVTLGLLIFIPSITLVLPDLYVEWSSYLRNSDVGYWPTLWQWLRE